MIDRIWINLDLRKTLTATAPSAAALRMLLQQSIRFWSFRLSQNRIFPLLLSSCPDQNQFITKIYSLPIHTNYSTDNRKSKDQEYQIQDHFNSEFQHGVEKINRKKNQVKRRNINSDLVFQKVDSGIDQSSNVQTNVKNENKSDNTEKSWNWNEIWSILRTAEAGLRIFRCVVLLKKMAEGGRQGGVTRSGSEAVFGSSTMTRKPERKKRDTTSRRW